MHFFNQVHMSLLSQVNINNYIFAHGLLVNHASLRTFIFNSPIIINT